MRWLVAGDWLKLLKVIVGVSWLKVMAMERAVA